MRRISLVCFLLVLIQIPLFSQVNKLTAADDLFIRQDPEKYQLKSVRAELLVREGVPGIPIANNRYGKKARLIDSLDAEGNHHRFYYGENDKMAQYDFVSTDFKYESFTNGEPEFIRSKFFTYNEQDQLIAIEYELMGERTHLIEMKVDKDGKVLSYKSFDALGEPAYKGYYTYTKFDSVLTYRDYTADSVLSFSIDYEYDKKKMPIKRVEKTHYTGGFLKWERSYDKKTKSYEIVQDEVGPGSGDDPGETFRLVRQKLTVEKQKKKLRSKTWEMFISDFPAAEMKDMPAPVLQDKWVSAYDDKGKLQTLSLVGDGSEPRQDGKVIYREDGLIDKIEMRTVEGQLVSTIQYHYEFHED